MKYEMWCNTKTSIKWKIWNNYQIWFNIGIQNQHLYISIHTLYIYMNRVYTMGICLKVDRGEVKILSFFVVFYEKKEKNIKKQLVLVVCCNKVVFWPPSTIQLVHAVPYIHTNYKHLLLYSFHWLLFQLSCFKKRPKKKEQKPKAVVVYTCKGASPWLAADGIAIHHTLVLR